MNGTVTPTSPAPRKPTTQELRLRLARVTYNSLRMAGFEPSFEQILAWQDEARKRQGAPCQ
ncbi:hypothetical protein [Deinococcus alpinitundrae]|uniref:hypothetical protein n=1 Tax=Deinococcus alpinitundrae TaxID=468913 RepID=UPI00137B49F9|nr:hypothetical protein [Deinococcus alpinitundrae]